MFNRRSCGVGGASGQWYASTARFTAHCKHGRRQWNTSEDRGRQHRHHSAAFPHRCLRGHGQWKGLHPHMSFFSIFCHWQNLRFCAGVDVKSARRFSRMLVDRVAPATQRDWQVCHLFKRSSPRPSTSKLGEPSATRVTAAFKCIWSPPALSRKDDAP